MRTDSLLFPNPTSNEHLKPVVQRSQARYEELQLRSTFNANKLQSHDDQTKGINTPISVIDGEFLLEIAVSTPAISFHVLLDISSDLVWVKYHSVGDLIP